MTRILKWLNNPYLLAILLLAGATTDLILIGRDHNLNKSEWATWVGSIGTIATLAGTVLLATQDRRRARKEAVDRAVVASAALAIPLKLLAGTLQNAVEGLLDGSPMPSLRKYRMYADLIDAHDTWTDDEILPLIVMPNHLCTRLAGMRSIIRQVVIDMRYVADNHSYSWMEEMHEKYYGNIVASLVSARDTVQFAAEECNLAVRNAVRS